MEILLNMWKIIKGVNITWIKNSKLLSINQHMSEIDLKGQFPVTPACYQAVIVSQSEPGIKGQMCLIDLSSAHTRFFPYK